MIDSFTFQLERSSTITHETILRWHSVDPQFDKPLVDYLIAEFRHGAIENCVFFGVRIIPLVKVLHNFLEENHSPLHICNGHSCYATAYRRPQTSSFLNNAMYLAVATGEQPRARLGPKSHIIMEPYLRSKGIGTFLLGTVLSWGKEKYPTHQLIPVEVSYEDGKDLENRQRRNRLYSRQGLHADLDPDGISGLFKLNRLSDAAPYLNENKFEDIGWHGLQSELNSLAKNLADGSSRIGLLRKKLRDRYGKGIPQLESQTVSHARKSYVAAGAEALSLQIQRKTMDLQRFRRIESELLGYVDRGLHLHWPMRALMRLQQTTSAIWQHKKGS